MAGNGHDVGLHFEGVLEKAGKRFFEGFRKRWFILDGKDLSYYKAPETTPENLLGIIDLTKVKAVVPFKMINNNAFQIITSTRTYTFTAATPQLMTEWISVLRQAMQLQSFKNKRAQKSFSSPSEEDAGYEVVSTSSRTSSDVSDQQAGGDANLYDQVTSSGNKDATNYSPVATYEAVGSFKRSSPEINDQGSYGVVTEPEKGIESYGSVGPAKTNNSPSEDPAQVGTYGVIWDPEVQTKDTSNTYSVVQKPKPSNDTKSGTAEAVHVYAEVGEIKPAPKINVAPMPIICESDDDDEDDDDHHGDGAFVEENIEEILDPLPPPKGSTYAVDQIRILLKDFKRDESVESTRENHVVEDEDTTSCTVIPDTSEEAFSKLKDFLNNLEHN